MDTKRVTAIVPGAIVIALTLMLGLALLSGTSSAEAKCWPNRPDNGQYYHDGWYRRPGTTVRGIEAGLMLNYDPWVQPNRFSTAWTMLTRQDHARWAQIGWIEWAYDVRYTFVQCTYNDVVYTHNYSPEGEGQFSRYTTLYDPERSMLGGWGRPQQASPKMDRLVWTINYSDSFAVPGGPSGQKLEPADYMLAFVDAETGEFLFSVQANRIQP